MRDYELVYILDPDLAEEVVTERMERFRTLALNQGAEIKSQERWEKRRLAYEIKKKREGIYVVMELNSSPECVREMDRILKITDGILRHLIVRAPEGIEKAGVVTSAPPVPHFEPVRAEPRPVESPAVSPTDDEETGVVTVSIGTEDSAEAESESADPESTAEEAVEPAAVPIA